MSWHSAAGALGRGGRRGHRTRGVGGVGTFSALAWGGPTAGTALGQAGVGAAGGAVPLLEAFHGAGHLQARGDVEAAAPHHEGGKHRLGEFGLEGVQQLFSPGVVEGQEPFVEIAVDADAVGHGHVQHLGLVGVLGAEADLEPVVEVEAPGGRGLAQLVKLAQAAIRHPHAEGLAVPVVPHLPVPKICRKKSEVLIILYVPFFPLCPMTNTME